MEKIKEWKLPEAFAERMERLLEKEAEAFFKSYEKERAYGLRYNPLKTGGREGFFRLWEQSGLSPAGLRPVPWFREGFFYEESLRPGKHPLHEAGAYYIQEPSAMSAGEAFDARPGERILDLCAAPGGKTTHAAGRMMGEGLLVSNEIHPARAKILSQNVERMGIGNAVVTNMAPAELVPFFPEFFDGVLVDAPCSGEGMFRKAEEAGTEWSPEQVLVCARRQEEILDCAAKMTRPGGRILYSTCTFAPEENEQTAARFLKGHPEFSLEELSHADLFAKGRPEWADGNPELLKTVRIWPHRTEGEGHFLALFRKHGPAGETRDGSRNSRGRNGGKEALEAFQAFLQENKIAGERVFRGRLPLLLGDRLYLVPQELLEQVPGLSGLKVLRPGLAAGILKKGRIEPEHGLGMFLQSGEAAWRAELGAGETAWKYLRGEALKKEEIISGALPEKGWVLVTAAGCSLGFAKAAGGVLKNHYPKGLRKP